MRKSYSSPPPSMQTPGWYPSPGWLWWRDSSWVPVHPQFVSVFGPPHWGLAWFCPLRSRCALHRAHSLRLGTVLFMAFLPVPEKAVICRSFTLFWIFFWYLHEAVSELKNGTLKLRYSSVRCNSRSSDVWRNKPSPSASKKTHN